MKFYVEEPLSESDWEAYLIEIHSLTLSQFHTLFGGEVGSLYRCEGCSEDGYCTLCDRREWICRGVEAWRYHRVQPAIIQQINGSMA